MILQILPKEKFTNGFIQFMEAHFSHHPMHFIVYGDDGRVGYEKYDANNIVSIASEYDLLRNGRCRKLIRSADAIILNWVSARISFFLLPYSSKTALVFWGGDLQSIIQAKGLVPMIANSGRIILAKKAQWIVTLLPSEYEALRKRFSLAGQWLKGIIWGSDSLAEVQKGLAVVRGRKRPDGKEVHRVLIGNSATPSNRHLAALELLSKYSSENIELIIPMSYGDASYRDKVSEVANELFGHKAIILTEFMNPDDYQELLGTIDIGVFNHDRQQGLGNIYSLLRDGAKVYVSLDGPMFADLKSEGYRIFPTESIGRLDYEVFIAMDESDRVHNQDVGDPIIRNNEAVAAWSKIIREIDSGQ